MNQKASEDFTLAPQDGTAFEIVGKGILMLAKFVDLGKGRIRLIAYSKEGSFSKIITDYSGLAWRNIDIPDPDLTIE